MFLSCWKYAISSIIIQTLIKDLGTVVNNLETAFSSHIVHVTIWLTDVLSLMHSKTKYICKQISKITMMNI